MNGGTAAVSALDTSGYIAAVIAVYIGANDADWTTLKLQESPDNSSWTDVAGADFSIGPNVLPSSSDSYVIWEWQINLALRQRYLRPIQTIGTGVNGAFLTTIAQLYPSPPQSTDTNATQQISI